MDNLYLIVMGIIFFSIFVSVCRLIDNVWSAAFLILFLSTCVVLIIMEGM